MAKREHLKRLESASYRGLAVVHWTVGIRNRRTGWLDGRMYYYFRELLTHTQFRYAIACPIFCMMPDHIHLIWMGILESTDQKVAMRHLRKRFSDSLSRIGFALQDQAYDHVQREDERQEGALMKTCEYIARNPERADLVPADGYTKYPFTGCLIPGYPELKPFEPDYWKRFNRSVSYLRKNI